MVRKKGNLEKIMENVLLKKVLEFFLRGATVDDDDSVTACSSSSGIARAVVARIATASVVFVVSSDASTDTGTSHYLQEF